MSRRPYPGEDSGDAEDRLYDDWVQQMIDDREEAKAKWKKASETLEELSVFDARMEGQKAGHLNLSASMNPYLDGCPEHQAWEMGRSCVIGAWLNGSLKRWRRIPNG